MSDTFQGILAEMTRVFARVLERSDIILCETTTAAEVEGWDSLTHHDLMTEIEGHFNLRFTLKEQARFQNVGDICRLIEVKKKG